MNSLYLNFSKQKPYMEFSKTLSEAMKACGTIPNAQKLHAHLISTGFASSIFLQNHLLNMYSKCGLVDDAILVFEEIEERNVFSWNTMISGLADSGRMKEARKLFDEMGERDCVSWNSMMSGYFQNGESGETLNVFALMMRDFSCEPDPFSLSCVLKACGSLGLLELGLQLHCLVKKFGFGRDPFLETSILDMYIKCGAMGYAEKVSRMISRPSLFCYNSMMYCYAKGSRVELAIDMFHRMPERDNVSWNTMISILSQHGYGVQTLSMFIEMWNQGFVANSMTYASVLSACASIHDLYWGKHLHARFIRSKSSIDVYVGSGLIDMYAKCGHLVAAKKVFNSLPEQNTVSWTTLIGGLAQFGSEEEAMGLFIEMRKVPMASDRFTLATVLAACSSIKDVSLGTQLHPYTIKIGLESAIPVANALLTMYAKCGKIKTAHHVFQLMPAKDIISWTAMLTAFSQIGDLENARQCFNSMPGRNVITWNSMLAAYTQHGHWEEGFKLYTVMLRESVRTDWTTYATLFGACADSATLRLGNQIIAQTTKIGVDANISVVNGMITMYSKCGRIEEAQEVFDSISEMNLISWNAMISGYAQNGQGTKAVQIFESMLKSGLAPDHISYVAVLSGCSHSGLVMEGKQYFDSMTKDHGISPTSEHFACMVDLLGRAGLLEDAKKMIDEMPMEACAGAWGALLSACRTHGNADLAHCAVKHLFELDPKHSGSYVLLANLYADSGNLNALSDVRKLMRERGIRKNPGCSWIEAGNRIHVFTVDDTDHPQINDVRRKLEELLKKIEDTGDYINKNGSEESWGYHSEKLAVAFGLLSLPGKEISSAGCAPFPSFQKWILLLWGLLVANDAFMFYTSAQMVRNDESEEQKNEEKKASLQQLPLQSSPYLRYSDLQEYKSRGYGTQDHINRSLAGWRNLQPYPDLVI
ncbi:hypothetical protein IFM89_024539 [Coptis chinensis]|uniref:Pentatricopeptide repeat-containing protein n=1 Tax=Coptis chinensis TaxID=261450 RepID=A0A835HRT7_9MAGN|nr:hypothetical protein IFM89_024539 [Coptis chinensis]